MHHLTKSDELVQRDVERELKRDSRIDASEIGVTVTHGIVTLVGAVPSSVDRRAAIFDAFRVMGVEDVVNEISVNLAGGDAIHDDLRLAGAVRHALSQGAEVDDGRIRSMVSDGWVTLAGEVTNPREAAEAEESVRRVPGVRGVIFEAAPTP